MRLRRFERVLVRSVMTSSRRPIRCLPPCACATFRRYPLTAYQPPGEPNPSSSPGRSTAITTDCGELPHRTADRLRLPTCPFLPYPEEEHVDQDAHQGKDDNNCPEIRHANPGREEGKS